MCVCVCVCVSICIQLFLIYRYLFYHDPRRLHVIHADNFHITSESFIKPQIIPPSWRHKIPKPLQQNQSNKINKQRVLLF